MLEAENCYTHRDVRFHPASPRRRIRGYRVLAGTGTGLPGLFGREETAAMPQEMMRAVRFHDYGPPENLVVDEVPRPAPGEGEVLVRVHAVGVHPFDWKLRKGLMREFMPVPLPHTPGADFAGVVATVGPGVEGLQVGDEIYGSAQATYAEYLTATVDAIGRKPANLTFVEAAAVPIGAATAWASVEAADVQPGQRVLVHGGAGGVGQYVVQLARHRGATVIGTASADNADLLRSLGAEQVIDYAGSRFEDIVRDVDAVIDTVGGELIDRSLPVVRKGGVVATIAGQPSQQRAAELGIRAISVRGKITADVLDRVTALIEDGTLRVQVSKVLPLDAAAEAHATSETGHSRGRLVLEVTP
jgi:NADPH:quinone reductase-like Zn-dependent oxidoreductase